MWLSLLMLLVFGCSLLGAGFGMDFVTKLIDFEEEVRRFASPSFREFMKQGTVTRSGTIFLLSVLSNTVLVPRIWTPAMNAPDILSQVLYVCMIIALIFFGVAFSVVPFAFLSIGCEVLDQAMITRHRVAMTRLVRFASPSLHAKNRQPSPTREFLPLDAALTTKRFVEQAVQDAIPSLPEWRDELREELRNALNELPFLAQFGAELNARSVEIAHRWQHKEAVTDIMVQSEAPIFQLDSYWYLFNRLYATIEATNPPSLFAGTDIEAILSAALQQHGIQPRAKALSGSEATPVAIDDLLRQVINEELLGTRWTVSAMTRNRVGKGPSTITLSVCPEPLLGWDEIGEGQSQSAVAALPAGHTRRLSQELLDAVPEGAMLPRSGGAGNQQRLDTLPR